MSPLTVGGLRMRPSVGGFLVSTILVWIHLAWIHLVSISLVGIAGVPAAFAASEAEDPVSILRQLESKELSAQEARQLVGSALKPEPTARLLLEQRAPLPEIFGQLLMAESSAEISEFLQVVGRETVLGTTERGPPWSDQGLLDLLSTLLIDPRRFVAEAEFRSRVLELLPGSWPVAGSPELRDRLLVDINRLRGVTFDDAERIEVAWGAVPRSSQSRRLARWAEGGFPGEVRSSGTIQASVFSLPSSFFSPVEAEQFLRAVAKAAPERQLLVLGDDPMLRRLLQGPLGSRIHWIETHGRRYSPWIRDPLLLRSVKGGWLFVERPNPQRGREEDAYLGRELLQGLPEALDRLWRHPKIVTAGLPFHNGQVLLTTDTTWIGLHTVELRVLETLQLERVPVASFTTTEGIDRYLAAADRAAEELAELYGRPVRWVHSLPRSGSLRERSLQMGVLGGGAGFDLDSLVTILQSPDGKDHVLIGDLEAGRHLLEGLTSNEWRDLSRSYELDPAQRKLVAGYQTTGRAARLQAFLDEIDTSLRRRGLDIQRLPLLLMPGSARLGSAAEADFLITWANVVVEHREGSVPRAEGFASLLPTGDAEARQKFARAGHELALFPPLVASILGNGGYRCASNHFRRPLMADPK